MEKGKLITYLTLILLAAIWGSSFILMKYGLFAYSSTQVAALRILVACLFLLPLAIPKINKVTKKQFWLISLSGLLGSFIPAFLFTKAQTVLDSSTVGVLNSTVPIFALVIGILFFKDVFNLRRLAGVFLGMAGAILLILLKPGGSYDPNYTYGLYVIIATLCYGLNINFIKYYLAEVPSLAISSISFLMVGIASGVFIFGFTDFATIMVQDDESVRALIYTIILGAVGTAFAIVIFNKLIKTTHPVFASSVTYLIPIVALFWGVIDGEPLGFVQVIGMALILLGVYLTNRKKKIKENRQNLSETI
ncbi:MAG: drug/metabolite transporter (DMT)-like permease [Sphingobacteriales bacterium]|jgi:drug/metabolite transporter (DMT)-like permease